LCDNNVCGVILETTLVLNKCYVFKQCEKSGVELLSPVSFHLWSTDFQLDTPGGINAIIIHWKVVKRK